MIRNVAVRLSANVGAFRAQMAAAGAAVKDFSGDVNRAAQANNQVARRAGMAMAVVGAAATAAAVASAKAAATLERDMQNVATIWTSSSVTIVEATDRVIEMSTRLPQTATVLAEGLYDIASSGFQGADALTVLEASGTAAAAGLTETAVAAKGISAVLNAYGMSAAEAGHVSDVLFQTVNLGVVTFEELAGSLGDFVGMASVAGVSIEEANAALATMTLSGLNASTAATSLNRVMQAFVKPSETMEAALTELYGAEADMALETHGLHQVINDLTDLVGGPSPQAMSALFQEIRGLRGALALTSNEGKTFDRVIAGMADTAEATQAALEEQSKSLSFQLDLMRSSILAVATEFGQALLPILKPIVQGITSMADAFRGLPDWMETATAASVILAGVVTGLGGAYLLLAPKILAAQTLMRSSAAAAGMAARAMTALKVSMGVIGIALIAASAAMAIFGTDTGKAERRNEELGATLDKTTQSLTAQSEAVLARRIAEEGLIDLAQTTGASLEDIAAALMGNEEAYERVAAAADAHAEAKKAEYRAIEAANEGLGGWTEEQNAAWKAAQDAIQVADELKTGVGDLTEEVEDTVAAAKDEAKARGAVSAATADETAAMKAQAEAQKDDLALIELQTKARERLAGTIKALFDPMEAYRTAQTAITDTAVAGDDRAMESMRARHGEERRLLDDRIDAHEEAAATIQEAEADAQAATQAAQKDAQDATHQAEKRAWDDRARAQDRALADRHRTLDRAHKDEVAQLQDRLDEELRVEKGAMDARVKALKRQGEDQAETEEDAHRERRAQLLFEIDTLFGAERQAAIAALEAEDDAHKQRMRVLEDETDAAIDEERTAYDKLKETREELFDDRVGQLKDQLDELKRTEKDALDDTQREYSRAMGDRHKAQGDALADRHKTEGDALADSHRQQQEAWTREHDTQRRALSDQQDAETSAAQARRNARETQHGLDMGQLQTHLQDQLDERDAYHANLEAIAKRGGEDVNAVMLEELAKLPPAMLEQLANSGEDAFDSFIATFKRGMEEFDVDTVALEFKKIGDGAGQAVTTGVLEGMIDIVSHPLFGGPDSSLVQSLQGMLPIPMPADLRARLHGRAEGHFAQVAPAGSMRLWAEPETGGEAYIPLAQSKRERSTSILAQVAEEFGYGLLPMAQGGMMAATSAAGAAGTTVHMPIHVDARVDAGIDMGAAGRVIADQVETGVRTALDQLGRQVAVKSWRR